MRTFLNLIIIFYSLYGFSVDLTIQKNSILNDSISSGKTLVDTEIDSIYYPEFITKEYNFLSEDIILQNTSNLDKLYRISQSNTPTNRDPFKGLSTKGSISRGINLGNNRNAVLNSELDLQIFGKLNEKVEITASIQDANIPLQDDGYSQKLDEFDQIFIELKSDKVEN